MKVDESSALMSASEIPEHFGRYRLIEEVGRGGMGVVYRAYDPHLQRKVALKIITPEIARGDTATRASRRLRLLHEAKALGRLVHPNVTAVYDVGVEDEHVYLAMEYIEGQTLSDWRLGRHRSWREILQVMLQAGQGLAAAHGAGIVHRDFKPDNLMVTDDGRAFVLDFGLVRFQAGDESDDAIEPSCASGAHRRHQTAVGSVLGTPAYMAPEQIIGGACGMAADQFAFCVTFLEALCGQRPFDVAVLDDRLLAIEAGAHGVQAMSCAGPDWLRTLLLRGLALEVEDRHASMDVLLDRTQAGLRRPARIVRGSLAAGLAALAVIGPAHWAAGQFEDACTSSSWQGSWDAIVRRDASAAFSATAVPHAGATWQRVAQQLDAHTRAWSEAERELCRQRRAPSNWPPLLLDLRRDCLARNRAQVETLVRELAQADAGLVQHAVQAVFGLSDVRQCADADALSQSSMQPPELAQAGAVEDLRARIDELRTIASTGRVSAVSGRARALRSEVEATGYGPLLSEYEIFLSRLEAELGDHEGAVESAEAALRWARATGHARVAAQAALDLTHLRGYVQNEWSNAHELEGQAVSLVHRVGDTPALEAELAWMRGTLRHVRGDEWGAYEMSARRLAIVLEEYGADHLNAGFAHASFGLAARFVYKYDEALTHYQRAENIWRATLGADHPILAHTLDNYGSSLRQVGQYQRSLAKHSEALEICERNFGTNNVACMQSRMYAAFVAELDGKLREAHAYAGQITEFQREAGGQGHPNLSIGGVMQARHSMRLGAYERAVIEAREGHALVMNDARASEVVRAEAALVLGEALKAVGAPERASEVWQGAESQLARVEVRQAGADELLVQLRGALDRGRGRSADALARDRQFFEQMAARVGRANPQIVWNMLYLADAHRGEGELDIAQKLLDEAEAKLEPETDLRFLDYWRVKAELAAAKQQWAAARRCFATAIAIVENSQLQAHQTGEYRFGLAQAECADESVPAARAHATARRARMDFELRAAAGESERRRVQAWLREGCGD